MEALRQEQERHTAWQDSCSSLQDDVKDITAALEADVKTLQVSHLRLTRMLFLLTQKSADVRQISFAMCLKRCDFYMQ
jgi:hypothetical protein